MQTTFKTSDGYTLHLVGGVWVDNLDPALVDMTFETWSAESGSKRIDWPVGHDGTLLDGRFVGVTS